MAYQFNLNEWLPRFPLQSCYDRFSGTGITGPGALCNNEQLRSEMQGQYDWGPPTPVDIFIMAEGEPEDRSVTKVGGLPFRSGRNSWPQSAGGEPMLFLAQFNFGDSLDIVGKLPGEMLLVFCNSLDINEVKMEWQTTALAVDELVGMDGVPPHPDQFAPCFGYRFRATSYPQAARRDTLGQQEYPLCRGLEVWSDYLLLQYYATQIGRAPFFIQHDDDQLPGTMLCIVSSIGEARETPYPFVNRPDPVPLSTDFRHLMLADTGCIYISLDDQQELHWGWSSF